MRSVEIINILLEKEAKRNCSYTKDYLNILRSKYECEDIDELSTVLSDLFLPEIISYFENKLHISGDIFSQYELFILPTPYFRSEVWGNVIFIHHGLVDLVRFSSSIEILITALFKTPWEYKNQEDTEHTINRHAEDLYYAYQEQPFLFPQLPENFIPRYVEFAIENELSALAFLYLHQLSHCMLDTKCVCDTMEHASLYPKAEFNKANVQIECIADLNTVQLSNKQDKEAILRGARTILFRQAYLSVYFDSGNSLDNLSIHRLVSLEQNLASLMSNHLVGRFKAGVISNTTRAQSDIAFWKLQRRDRLSRFSVPELKAHFQALTKVIMNDQREICTNV